MKKIRSQIKNWLNFDFFLNDVYNMNETNWFWKAMFDKTLSSASNEDMKIDKIKITTILCTNVFDQHKLKSWFIDNVKNSQSFDKHDVHVENLRMMWRVNRTIWMIDYLFDEYLNWFRKKINNRKSMLLIDDFSTHEIDIDVRELKKKAHDERQNHFFVSQHHKRLSIFRSRHNCFMKVLI